MEGEMPSTRVRRSLGFLLVIGSAFSLAIVSSRANAQTKKKQEKPNRVAAIPRNTQLFGDHITLNGQFDSANGSSLGNRPARGAVISSPRFALSGLFWQREAQLELRRTLTPEFIDQSEQQRFPFSIAIDPASILGRESQWRIIADQTEFILNQDWAKRDRKRGDRGDGLNSLGGLEEVTTFGLQRKWGQSTYLQGTAHDQGVSISGYGTHCFEFWPRLCAVVRPQLNVSKSMSALMSLEGALELQGLPSGAIVRAATQFYGINFGDPGGAASIMARWEF